MEQPAVAKTVAHMAERLGARLPLRSTRGLAPAEAGQRFYLHARRTIEEAEQAEQAVRDSSDGFSGRPRMGAAACLAGAQVVPRSTP
ncbi:hypothetical protein [Caballeronia sp. HLA56]